MPNKRIIIYALRSCPQKLNRLFGCISTLRRHDNGTRDHGVGFDFALSLSRHHGHFESQQGVDCRFAVDHEHFDEVRLDAHVRSLRILED